jgi:hypothetical protein
VKKYYLALEKDLKQKSIYPLEGAMSIGRRSENDIVVIDWTVSRSHARISYQKDRWVVEDLGSANGIFYDGKRVTSVELQAEDTFEIGAVTFRFIEEQALAGARQLSETIEVFTSTISHQPLLLKHLQAKAEFEALRERLLTTPVLRSLNDAQFNEVEALLNLHLFDTDKLIIKEGDPGRSLYIILNGEVGVFTSDYDGNEFDLATLGASQFFGEISLLTGRPRSTSVIAREETLLGEVNYSLMCKLMSRSPEVKDVMVEYYHERTEDSKQKRAEAGMEDRRGEPRLNERLLVRFNVSPEGDFPEEMITHTYKATTSDVSVSGALLEVMGPAMSSFCAECQLRLEIELPPLWGKIRTLAVVRNVIPSGHMTRVGIEFLGTTKEDEEKLREFIIGESHLTH